MNTIWWTLAILIAIPMMVWSFECLAGLVPPRRRNLLPGAIRPRVAVLIPAHNEAHGIRATLENVFLQLAPGDRLIVIADNCTDSTAQVARDLGAQAVERFDPIHSGKGYALQAGVDALVADPPDVYVMVDADCTFDPGTLDGLSRLAFGTGRPVQAAYLLAAPEAASAHHELAALGLLIKNVVRPRGLDRLDLPCFLNGSGMAFPRAVLERVPLASGKIAEDKWLTVDLACRGHLALFFGEGVVRSRFPTADKALMTQHKRWLHGHLECMLTEAPRLIAAAIRRRQFGLFALALDLLVPPLSLLMLLWSALETGAVISALAGAGWAPAAVAACAAATMALTLAAVALRMRGLTARSFRGLSAYMFSRLPVYVAFMKQSEKQWVRTERDPPPPK